MGELAALPEITFVASLVGRADILAMTLVRDGADLTRYLHQTIDKIEGVHRIEYSLTHKFLKHDFRYASLLG
jgi:Lrp/AsnC family transcriptional regulator for asnA, asnC and gidA